MAGFDSFMFLKVLCDLERKKIDTIPDEEFIHKVPAPNQQLGGETNAPCFMKIYMQDKFGVGGSPGSKRYACPRCSCLFRQKRHLRKHLQYHCHHKCLGCSECYANINQSFKELSETNDKPAKAFKCLLCTMLFKTEAGLTIHQECHPQLNKVFKCELCSEQFDNRWNYEKHQKTHVTSVIYECKDCDKAFHTPANLAKHVRVRHKKAKANVGDRFPARVRKKPANEMEYSAGKSEDESKLREILPFQFTDSYCKDCGLCNETFKTPLLNKTHVCSKFLSFENMTEDSFEDGFKCPACSQVYSSFLALKMHCRTHTGADPLRCSQCDKNFSSVRKMNDHFEVHGRNTCKKCDVMFVTKLSYLLHHCGYTQRCFVCDDVFPSHSSFVRHLRIHPIPKHIVYKCTECKKSFKKESYFRAHQIDHTGKQPFECLECDKKFLTFGPFKNHAKIHVVTQARKCTACNKTFKSDKLFHTHTMTHLVKKDGALTCEDCDLHFENEAALVAHQSKCAVEESPEKSEESDLPTTTGFQCEECSKVFRKKHQLSFHLRDQHKKAPEYLFFCEFCSKGFYHKMHLNSHKAFCSQRDEEKRKQITKKEKLSKRNTFGERQFQCPECDKKYFNQIALNTHMYVHRDPSECPYQCPVCGIGYARQYNYNQHVKKCKKTKNKHTFKCKTCGATFLNEKTLDRHSKAHGKEWECALCKEKFITLRGFTNHKKLCTPETAKYKTFRKPTKPQHLYTCPKCERTFLMKDRFEAHVAAHEGITRYQCDHCFHRFMSVQMYKRHKCKLLPKEGKNDKEGEIDIKHDLLP